MSVDLTDPHILSAYEDVFQIKSKDWLLLTYGQTRDRLSLFASGEGGVDTLRVNIPRDQEDVYFGFCREEENGRSYYALIAYVPESVSGVRRARALVHSRAVGSLFKVHQATLNANRLDQVNSENVRERLHLGPSYIPRINTSGRIQRSASEPMQAKITAKPVPSVQGPPIRISNSEMRPSPHSLSATTTVSHVVSQPQVVRRLQEWDDGPPPTPPKDKFSVLPSTRFSAASQGRSSDESGRSSGLDRPQPALLRASTRSELAYASDNSHEEDEVVVIEPTQEQQSQSAPHPRSSSQASTRSPIRPMSPAEKARLRAEAHRQREAEEQLAIQEEAERQLRLKIEKETALRREHEEDEQRRLNVEKDKRRAVAERARRERERMQEDAQRERELEAKKQADREKRMLEARKLEDARRREKRRAEEVAKKKEEERRAADEEKRAKMKEIQRQYKLKGGADSVLLTGTVTVQTSTSITWKRRFFELSDNALLFYKDSLDRTRPLDIMDLKKGHVRAIREPSDGYEELESISHAFAVEFMDGDGPWSLFADSAEDKDILVSLLSQAAGL